MVFGSVMLPSAKTNPLHAIQAATFAVVFSALELLGLTFISSFIVSFSSLIGLLCTSSCFSSALLSFFEPVTSVCSSDLCSVRKTIGLHATSLGDDIVITAVGVVTVVVIVDLLTSLGREVSGDKSLDRRRFFFGGSDADDS